MYFTPEKLVAYIESGGIIDPSEPASNFLVDVYEIIMGKPQADSCCAHAAR